MYHLNSTKITLWKRFFTPLEIKGIFDAPELVRYLKNPCLKAGILSVLTPCVIKFRVCLVFMNYRHAIDFKYFDIFQSLIIIVLLLKPFYLLLKNLFLLDIYVRSLWALILLKIYSLDHSNELFVKLFDFYIKLCILNLKHIFFVPFLL